MSTPPLPEGVSNTRRNRVANSLHSAAIHLLRRARQEDRASGLSPERLSVLSVLVFAGPRTGSELAEIEMVSRPAITRILHALEASGHVRREQSRSDRRVWVIHATDSGRRAIEVARVRRLRRVARELDELGDRELRTVEAATEILEKIGR